VIAYVHGGSHNDGYAMYLLGRYLWHWLHWWTIPVIMAVTAVLGWVRTLFGGGP